MQNLIRRPSGVYVFRLSVPRRLRHVIGKREVVVTTGTRELSVAKIVGASLASQWLQQFFESDRLLSVTNTSAMPHDDLLKIAHGHPTLLTGSTLKLTHAAAAAGLTTRDLLQAAADGRLELFIRAVHLPGYLLPMDRLEPVDASMGFRGGIVVPLDDNYLGRSCFRCLVRWCLSVVLVDTIVHALTRRFRWVCRPHTVVESI